MALVFISKRLGFCAAHRLYNPKFDDATNERIFGPCANANSHGHNYEVEVTVAGVPNPDTGMVMNLVDLKALLVTHVFEVLDHRHLDLDTDFLGGRISTAENLAIAVWEKIEPHVHEATLYSVEIFETPTNRVTYRGPAEQLDAP